MVIVHYIQKHILDELRASDSRRYAELNPDEIESGHFRYHLTQLVKDGYVEQLDRGLYALTTSGKHHVDTLSEGRVTARPMPKVITYTLLRDTDTILLYKKPKQPYLGLLNMVGGKLHEGETAQHAAAREVYEKAGVTIPSPELAGIFEVMIHTGNDLLTHVIAYVFVADVTPAEIDSPLLQPVATSDLLHRDDLAPDFLPMYQRIQNRNSIQIATFDISSGTI